MVSIGFSTTNKFISKAIRWLTKSRVSHCFIMFDWLGKKWVLEAGFFGVGILPLERFLADGNVIVEVVDLPAVELEDLVPAMEDMGERYDFGGLLGGIFPLIGKWFRQKWHNPLNNTKALFCSEFIVYWLKDLAFEPAYNLVPEDVSPEELLKLLEKNSEA